MEPRNEDTPKDAGTVPVPPTGNRVGGRISTNRDIAAVQAEYYALANDLEQAQALASTLEMQLSGKTNELAQFKLIWERTQADLARFEKGIEELRRERHTLANQVQRSYANDLQFEKLKKTHEELKAKAQALETELLMERAARQQAAMDLSKAREAASAAGARPAPAPNDGISDPELRATLQTLRDQLDRVLATPSAKSPAKKAPPPRIIEVEPAEHIEISFGT